MTIDRITSVESTVRRQNEWRGSQTLNLIASENVLSPRARALLGSDFSHRYAEGHPGKRYYEGTEQIDTIEAEAVEVMREIFRCAQAEVRPVSGTNANDSVLSAVIPRGGKVLVNSLAAGGHISHGKMGMVGKFAGEIHTMPLTSDGWHIDGAATKDWIIENKPDVVLVGKSLILFPEPVAEIAPACKEVGATLVYDGAHVLGLIAGRQFQDPLSEGAEILLGSTHKTFPGPQRGVVLSNWEGKQWKKIDRATFPGSHSNHHLDTLPPLLVTALEWLEFGEAYAAQIVANAKAYAEALDRNGFDVAAGKFGYTESHQVAVNMGAQGGGKEVSAKMRENEIICNMNLLPDEEGTSPMNPNGIRMGVQELTRVGMLEDDMQRVADLMKDLLVDGKDIKDAVHELRASFADVYYCYSTDGAAMLPQAATA